MDFHIQIDNLTVNEIRASSGIFSGENSHAGWSVMDKANTGLSLGGTNISHGCINIVSDRDSIDMWDKSGIVGNQFPRRMNPE